MRQIAFLLRYAPGMTLSEAWSSSGTFLDELARHVQQIVIEERPPPGSGVGG